MAGPGGKEVGRVSIRVVPNTDGFARKLRSDLQREINKAEKGLKAKVGVEVDANGLRQKVKAAANSANATTRVKVDVNTSGIGAAVAQIMGLRKVAGQRILVDVDVKTATFLGAIAGAKKGISGVLSVMGTLVKVGAVLTGVLAVLGPPLTALGAVTIQQALHTVGVAAGALSALGAGAVAGGFIFAAAKSEEVKKAWKSTGDHVKQVFTELNKPVENALVRMAPEVSKAFDLMKPNIERVSQGISEVIDSFSKDMPRLATALGTTMEQMWAAGRPNLERLLNALPNIITGFGNFFEIIGNSPSIQKIWGDFLDDLPRYIENFAKWIDKASEAYLKMKDWLASDDLKGFRDGLSSIADKFKKIDWSKLVEGIEDLMNSFGKWLEEIDLQAWIDNFGKAAKAVSKVSDMLSDLGVAGTLAAAAGAAVGWAILSGVTKALVGLGAKWLIGKLFGKTADIASEALDVGIGAGGAFAEGLASGIASGLGAGIGSLIGNLLGNLIGGSKDQHVNLIVDSVVWPEGAAGPSGPFTITGLVFPEGFDPAGFLAALMPAIESLNALILPIQTLAGLLPIVVQSMNTLSGVLSSLIAVIQPVADFITGVLVPAFSAISGIAGTVIGAISSIIGQFSSLQGVLDLAGSAFEGLLNIVASIAPGIAALIEGLVSGITGILSSGMAGIRAAWNGDWQGMLDAIGSMIGQAVALAASLPGLILGALGDMGSYLYGSGVALVQGFINGIESMINAAGSAAGRLVAAVAGLFPSSPAKEGPFSGHGWTPYRGQALVEGFAEGIRSATGVAVDATKDLMLGIKNEFLTVKDIPVNLKEEIGSAGADVGKTLYDRIGMDTFTERMGTAKEIAVDATRDLIDGIAKEFAGIDDITDKWDQAMNESKLGQLPQDFAKATGDQFLTDLLGFAPGGAIGALASEIMNPRQAPTYIVKDVDEAHRKEDQRQNREKLQFTGR